jgi:hypothetical protein
MPKSMKKREEKERKKSPILSIKRHFFKKRDS